jgi:hypothetical protein
MRRRGWFAVVLGAVLLTVTPAGAQTVAGLDDTVDQTVDTVSSTVTNAGDTVNQTVDTVSSTTSDAGDAVNETVDTVASTAEQTTGAVQGAVGSATGSASTSSAPSGGGSTSSGSATSSGSSGGSARAGSREGARSGSRAARHRTRFDRLPRRFETLLERIEFGRNVRANIRRLEHLLASASPALRARVLRLLRAEIRRLRADGVTRAERARIERLQLTARALRTSPPPAAATQRTPSEFSTPHTTAAMRTADGLVPTRVQPQPTRNGGVLAGHAGEGPARADAGGGNGAADAGQLPPVPQLPDRPDEFPFVIGLILLALVGLGLAGVVAGFAGRLLGRVRSG